MKTAGPEGKTLSLENYWVNPFSKKQTLFLRLSVLPWAIGVILFAIWWFRPEHHISFAASIIGSTIIFFEIITPAYFYSFLRRIKVVNPNIQPSQDWRLAIVVTRAPSEPWEVVKRTLVAMINQDIKHDTWLADEQPTEEIIEWCKANNVFVSSRYGISEYHQLTWPRRTRCKEGNLAYFYDNYGYEKYDIVAQLDADHVPEPDYLREICKPFVDPLVGYVAAPSICDANASESWSARGRLYAEATLHGPLQSGYNDKWAPLCIGSHYCVRTKALREIGGLGPELAEDHSTTLMMNAHGWKGVFQPYAIAHGDGPSTFPDCMIQEFQWSRSLIVILLRYTPKYFSGLSFRKKFQFLFSQTWYTLFSSIAIIGYSIPIFCLILDNPLLRMTYVDFLIYSTGVSLLNFIPVILLSRYGFLRPQDTKILSWEYTLFSLSRFPWVFAGIINGVTSTVLGTVVEFRVTPKGKDLKPPLLTRMLTPYLVISLCAAGAVVVLSNRTHAAGYYFLALVASVLMWITACAITVLHYREGGSRKISNIAKSSIWLSIAAILIIVAAFMRIPQAVDVILARTVVGTEDASSDLETSSSNQVALQGSSQASDPLGNCKLSPCFGYHDYSGSLTSEKVPADLMLTFIPWGDKYHDDIKEFVSKAERNESVPILTLEFWPWALIELEPRETYKARESSANASLLHDIVDGLYDEVILSSLSVASRSAKSIIIIRPMHEMEATRQYPWFSENPDLFISAYRHVVRLSRNASLDNIRWMWSPVGFKHASAYWPAAEFVDYVGLSIYATPEWNAGLAPEGVNLSMDQLLKARYWVRKYDKPIILAEVGVNDLPGKKVAWLKEAFDSLTYFPGVIGWVYFNQRQPPVITLDFGLPDWSLTEKEAVQLRQAVEDLRKKSGP